MPQSPRFGACLASCRQTTELWLGGREAAAVAAAMGPSRAVVLDEMAMVETELERVRALTVART